MNSNNYTTRSFDLIKDWPDVCYWWQAQDWPVIPRDHLSTMGFIGEINGKKAVAAWVYTTNSAFCLLEYIVINPEIRREERKAVFDHFINDMIEYTKGLGFKTVFLTTKSEGLISRLTKHEFQTTDIGMKNLIRRL